MSDDVVLRANRRATLSMALGLSSILCLCFTGLPAVGLGLASMGSVGPSHRIRAIVGIASGGIMTLLMLVLMAVGPEPGAADRSLAETLGTPPAPATPAPSLPVPDDERALCSALTEAAAAYRAGSNDLKRSATRGARRRALASVLGGGRVDGWVGHASELTTNGDGKAIFSVSLPCDASVGTWNNALSDIGSNTLIPQSSPLFSVLADLEVGGWGETGTPVRFSGTFVTGSGPDGFSEKSLTELGSMTEPAFVFRFSTVQALSAP